MAAFYAKFDVAGVEMCGVHFGDAGTVFEAATHNWMAPWPNPTDKFVVGYAEDAFNLFVDLEGAVWFRDFDEHTAGGFHHLADSMEALLSRLIRRFMEVGNEPLVWAHRLERLSRTVLEQLDDDGRLLAPSVEEPLPATEDEFFATARRLSWREAFYLPSLQQADLRHALQNGPPGKTKLRAPLAYVDEDGEVVAVLHVDEDEDRRLFVRRGA
mgnify:CR=1 FL=1